jgi:hypothetical protein
LIPICNKSDLAEAASQHRALVFLWVNWAVHAYSSRRVVEAVVESWQVTHPDLPAPCYVVDVSEQCGELWDALRDWLESEDRPASQLMMSGAGPLLWVHNSRVVAHAFPNQLGHAKVEAVCHSMWG